MDFPTLPPSNIQDETHPPSEPISVGKFIYSAKYPAYIDHGKGGRGRIFPRFHTNSLTDEEVDEYIILPTPMLL